MNVAESPPWTVYLPLAIFFVALGTAAVWPILAAVTGEKSKSGRRNSLLLLGLAFGISAGLAWFFGVWAAMSASWWFCPAFLAWGAVLVTIVAVRHRSKAAVGLGTLFAAGMIFIHVTDLTPRKPYRRFFNAIEPGMSSAEVLAALQREFPVGGKFNVPATHRFDEGLLFQLDLRDSRYNAETISLRLREEKVVGKSYSAD